MLACVNYGKYYEYGRISSRMRRRLLENDWPVILLYYYWVDLHTIKTHGFGDLAHIYKREKCQRQCGVAS